MNNYVDPAIYDEYYFRNWVVGAEEFKKGELHSFFKKSIELADIKSKDSVLDIGFGRGEVIKYLIPHCKSIVGVDYAKVALKIAREIIPETEIKVKLICDDINNVLPSLGMFDKVFLLDIVEHMYPWQLEIMYKELIKHLNDKAIIIIHTPIADTEAEKHYIDKINPYVIKCQEKCHINLNSFEEHTKYLKDYGQLERIGKMHIKFTYNKL